MRSKLKKLTLALTISLILSLLIPFTTSANMFNTFSGTNTFTGDNMNMMNGMNAFSAQNFSMDAMQQQFMNNLLGQTNNQQSQQKSDKVSASGFLTKDGDKYYIGEGDERHQIITEKGDMLAVMPILAGKEVPIEFIGRYDQKNQIVYAERMNLLKRPSSDLMDEIDEAIREFEKTQPISGRGYIVTNEEGGGYILEVHDEEYTIETDSQDILSVLPLVADNDDLIIELIGHLHEGDMVFEALRLNFVSKVDEELIEQVNRVLLENKDGEEVNANGYVRGRGGEYTLKVQNESYSLIISDEHPDIQQVIPVLANEELLTNIVGVLNLGNKSIDVKKVNIIDAPSPRLQREIAKALEGYEEGEGSIRGKVSKEGGNYIITSDEKTYDLSAKAEDLIAFLDAISGEDVMVEIYGYISNRDSTVDAEVATVIGDLPNSVRVKLANALEDFIELPESGTKVDAQGTIVSEDGKYYIMVAFHLYEIETEKDDIARALPVLSDTGLSLIVTGAINNENKSIDAEHLTILEVPSEEIQEEMDELINNSEGSGNNIDNSDKNNNNNPFANFGGFFSQDGESPFSGFGNLFGEDSLFGNFGSLFGEEGGSLFSNFGSLFGGEGDSPFGNLGNIFGGDSPFGNFGSLFESLGGESSLFSSLFSGDAFSSMPSLSFDQIQQELDKIEGDSNTDNGGDSDGDDTPTFGNVGDDEEDTGFSVGD